ncbi:hypothetical protein HNR23_004112 [Nocardiopsis mwathae]|uniref:Uncharacterized protein n=1 Tax=Nocardiopsis mwathae TaxID=1472723 RepID=A0A7W9YL37_9ACTN|nr:hypothetical protein [Nocardiopsis mwathae]MBB6174052.1 hypothetical protein [Nocardiopsis mwathae]
MVPSPSLRTGVICSMVCLIAMLGVSLLAWDALPALSTTREATEHRAATEVPRWVIATSFPAVTVLLTVLIVAHRPIDRAFAKAVERVLPLPAEDEATKTSNLNVVLAVLAPFLLALHCVILAVETGRDFPVLPVVLALVAALLVALGLLLGRYVAGDLASLARAIRKSGP